jgi:hypothetical protein
MARNAHTRSARLARVLLVVLVALAGAVVAGVAPAAATQQAQGPTVTDVTTTRANGTLTVTVRATNVTEVDVTGIPESWSVASHADNYGVYANQLDDESRVLWLWRIPVAVNVSVTFSASGGAPEPAPDLAVVPYDGTDRGQSVAVFPDVDAVTPTSTPTVTSTSTPVTATPGDAPTATPVPAEDGTPTSMSGDVATDTTDGSGAGPGIPGTLVALATVVLVVWRR